MKRIGLIAAVAYVLAVPGAVAGQVAWDSPALIRPGAPSGLSLFLIEAHPSDDLGALAVWRSAPAPVGIGLRGGIAEEPGGDAAGLVGLDISGTLANSSSSGTPDVIWWTGAGLGFGSEVLATFPLGVVLGWRGADESVTFAPHIGGHLALDVMSGPGDDLDLDGAVDLGIDLGFQSGFMIRFGAAVGGRDAIGIGLRLPR